MDRNKLILFAEDSLTQAESIKMMLEANGFIAIHARNGEEAMEMVKKKRPDLILSDIIMPGMSGYDFCRSVKSDRKLRSVPVVLLTSLSDVEDVMKGLESGADNYIMKPFEEGQLISRINTVLHKNDNPGDRFEQENIDVLFEGKKYLVNSSRYQILNMLLSTYEGVVERTTKLTETQAKLNTLRKSLEILVDERTRDLQDQIHERELVESGIRESEKKYRLLVENALVGVFSVDTSGEILLINEALCRALEYNSSGIINKRGFGSLFQDREAFDSLVQKLGTSGQVKNFEVKMVTASGGERWMILNAVLKNKTVSGMIMDISGRKLTEEKELKYQEELREARDRAEESDHLKSTFLSNMSHEIRTPMNAIIGFSSLLSNISLTPEKKSEFIVRISKNCYELLNLVENILDLAKIEAGQVIMHEKRCPVNKLLEDVYTKFSAELSTREKNQISFKLVPGPKGTDLTVISDPLRIYQVLSRLLDNAFKFTEKGTVELGYTILNKYIQFHVKDTGVGLTDEQKRYVFERFRKAEETKTKLYSGAGLGLSICKKLVELMGGETRVESEPGRGSEFYFTIPMKIAGASETIAEEKLPDTEQKSLSDRKILVAEDNLFNFKLIEALLVGTGTEIIWAKDGMEAVEFFKSGKHADLVLMDMRMPVMDGITATREIRKINKKIPVLAVSAYTMDEVKEKAIEAGCNDFLSKPVNSAGLVEMMKRYINETG
ncbi:MAG: response regulator [Bacteroidales bacterium]|nr:response regulator [Bacteroidales bacterium]